MITTYMVLTIFPILYIVYYVFIALIIFTWNITHTEAQLELEIHESVFLVILIQTFMLFTFYAYMVFLGMIMEWT